MHGLARIRLDQRLAEAEQAVEALIDMAVEGAAAGAEGLLLTGEPEMPDAVGHAPGLLQRRDQRVIADAPLFGGQREAVVAKCCEPVARAHRDHRMPRRAQPVDHRGGDGFTILEDQPGQRVAVLQHRLHIGHIGEARAPVGQIAPVGHVGMARHRDRRRGHVAARFDEIGGALEAVGRQHHAVAAGLAPDLAPVGLDPAGPEPADHADEIEVVREFLFGVAQAGEDLPGFHAGVHLRQGGERLAGADFEEHAVLAGGQRVHAIGEMHGVAQLFDPVIRVGRLRRRDRLAAAVRHEGHGGRLQVEPGEEGAVVLEDRGQHARMRGDVDGDALPVDLGGGQPFLQGVEGGIGAGDGGQFRAVHAGDVEILAHEGAGGLEAERDAEHAARGHGVEEAAAQQHQVDQVFEAHDTREAGGDVFAHGMAHHGGGFHAPAHPELRQRVFHDGDQRQLHRGFLERLGGGGAGLGFGQPERADVVIELRLQMVEAPVHPFGEDRLGLVEVARHVGILRAAAGEHEHHLGRVAKPVMGEDAAGVAFLQQPGGLGMAFGHHHAAFLEAAAAVFQRVGDIGQRLLGMGAQMGREGRGIGVERGLAAGRDAQGMEGKIAFLRGFAFGRFLEDGMGVGAADPKRVDRGAPGCVGDLPAGQPVGHRERAAVEGDGRVRCLIAQRGRDLGMVQRKC